MTLALSMITNDAGGAARIIEKYSDYFDRIYITVADKNRKEFSTLQDFKQRFDPAKIKLTYFKWCDDFGKAREFNREEIDTDYWFWMDDDDEIENPEKLRDIVEYMESKDLDVVRFMYNYYQNKAGEGINDHWRERIIRTDSELKWADVPVHETVIAPYARSANLTDVTILHKKDLAGVKKSHERNVKLLEKHWEKTQDPRSAYYLGMELMAQQKWEEAVEMFRFLIDKGGWDEEKYDAWCKVADCYIMAHNYNTALVATNMAIGLDPAKPDAYWQKVLIYGHIEQYEHAIEWSKVAMTKNPPQSLRVTDPTLYKYRGIFMAAQCNLFSGQVKEAWKLFIQVQETAPHFIKEQSEEVDWAKLFEKAYVDDKAIDYTKYLLHYTKGEGGNPQKILSGLPPVLLADPRLNAERAKVFPPVKWPEKSIAFFCGAGMEQWGPDTLEKGMGGSEEAVVYLSRELAKLGWNVTVFNDREEEFVDYTGKKPTSITGRALNPGVLYKPWTMLNPYDTFDVFIASRAPENANGVKARKVLIDLHDTVPEDRVYAVAKTNKQAVFMVKSQYHRDLYKDLPDERFVIVGNGILEEQFS